MPLCGIFGFVVNISYSNIPQVQYSRGVGQITIEAVRIETDELGALYLYVTSGLIGNSSDGNYYRYGIIDSITALE